MHDYMGKFEPYPFEHSEMMVRVYQRTFLTIKHFEAVIRWVLGI